MSYMEEDGISFRNRLQTAGAAVKRRKSPLCRLVIHPFDQILELGVAGERREIWVALKEFDMGESGGNGSVESAYRGNRVA